LETEAVWHQAVEGKVEKPVEQLKAQWYVLAGKAQVGHFEPYVEPPMENLPLEPSGVLHFDPDLAHLGLPHPGRAKDEVRPDLAQAVVDGLYFFGAVDGETGHQARGHRHHLLATPRGGGKGQVVLPGAETF